MKLKPSAAAEIADVGDAETWCQLKKVASAEWSRLKSGHMSQAIGLERCGMQKVTQPN